MKQDAGNKLLQYGFTNVFLALRSMACFRLIPNCRHEEALHYRGKGIITFGFMPPLLFFKMKSSKRFRREIVARNLDVGLGNNRMFGT
jgi:hypothetical protein